MKISRKDILEAIRTETNFLSGYFVKSSDDVHDSDIAIKNDPKCRVCAVGSVFKFKLPKNSRIRKISDVSEELVKHYMYDFYVDEKLPTLKQSRNYLIKNKMWLSLLSCEFEEYCTQKGYFDTLSKRNVTNVKKYLIKFVKKNFPAGEFTATYRNPR